LVNLLLELHIIAKSILFLVFVKTLIEYRYASHLNFKNNIFSQYEPVEREREKDTIGPKLLSPKFF